MELLSSVPVIEFGPWLWLSQSEEFSLELWLTGEEMECGWLMKGSLWFFLLGGSGGAMSGLGKKQSSLKSKAKINSFDPFYNSRLINSPQEELSLLSKISLVLPS